MNGVTGGNGTLVAPYTIQGWTITACCQAPGIMVENTSAYFAVDSVTVYATSYSVSGIVLANATNGLVENSQLTSFLVGMSIESSSSILMKNDTFLSSTVDHSQNVTVTGISRGFVTVTSSNDVTVRDNAANGQLGVSLIDSTNVTVTNNSLSQLTVQESTSDQFDSLTITSDNTANGRPLLFFKECQALDLNDPQAGQLIVADCNDVAISNYSGGSYYSSVQLSFVTNVVLDNITRGGPVQVYRSSNVTVSNSSVSMIIEGSDGVVLNNNNPHDVIAGISVSSSDNVSIVGNRNYAVTLADSDNITLDENDLGASCCTTDFTGLNILNSESIAVVGNSFFSDWEIVAQGATSLTINDNQFFFGAYTAITVNQCHSVSIRDNLIRNAGGSHGGVTVLGCENVDVSGNNMTRATGFCCGGRIVDLLTVSDSDNVTVQHNSLSDSNTAVQVYDSSNVTILENNIQSNDQGVFLNDTKSIQVFHNNFLNNTVQAVDTFSGGNLWDNGYPSGGNFWSNYTGSDPDMDGIGDTPLTFSNNQDNFPLMQRFPA